MPLPLLGSARARARVDQGLRRGAGVRMGEGAGRCARVRGARRSWQRWPLAGCWLARACHFLPAVPGLSRPPRCLRAPLPAARSARRRRLLGARRRAGGAARGRTQPRAARGARPWARGVAFRRLRESAQPASRLPARARASFFPVLQILGSSRSGSAGRKLAGRGRGWRVQAAPRLCARRAEEVGGWVDGAGVGARTCPPRPVAAPELSGAGPEEVAALRSPGTRSTRGLGPRSLASEPPRGGGARRSPGRGGGRPQAGPRLIPASAHLRHFLFQCLPFPSTNA